MKNLHYIHLFFIHILTFIIIYIVIMHITAIYINAADSGSVTVDDMLDNYNLNELDKAVDGLDFDGLVKDIIQNKTSSGTLGFKDRLWQAVAGELKNNRKGLIQVILISVISAIFANLAGNFKDSHVSRTGQLMAQTAMSTILIAIYSCTARIASDVLDNVVNFLKMLMPSYLTCVAVSSGKLSTAAFGEGLMLLILVVNLIFSGIVITGGHIYILLTAADSVAAEANLEKIAKLVLTLMNWIMKTAMAAIIGINLIQSMVLPAADGIQSGLITKALKFIPGIGNGVSAVSSTLIGAGALIKNGIGAAALIVLITICVIPAAQIGVFVITYQIAGAFIQPVAGKRFADTVNNFVLGMRLMLSVVIQSLATIFIVIAIICLSTNINYT